ncbi:MAG: WYL domain-containing protein [Polyangiaceae bacterium]
MRRVSSTSKSSGKVGRPKGSFTQARRIDKMRAVLEAHPNGVTLRDLAGQLRVTPRSVRRYLDELANQTELEPVATVAGGAQLWRIKPSERGRSISLRRTQAYGLLAARQVFVGLRGSALYEELDVVRRQLLQVARRPTRAGVKGEVPGDQGLEDRFMVVPPAPHQYGARGEEVDDVFHAVANLHRLAFRYRASPHPHASHERVVCEPYALVLHRGALTCVGRDVDRLEMRVFVLDRMTDVRPRDGETFTIPPDFRVGDYVHGEFGIAPPRGEYRVLVEFDPRAADAVKARRLHPSQKIATAPDGRVRLSMTVTYLDEVATWILGFGPLARVLAPDELVNLVVGMVGSTLARYER